METHSQWKPTPWWQRLLGYPAYRRSVYASWMIGGGWDGWEFSATKRGAKKSKRKQTD